MNQHLILNERQGPNAVVTLNRPERHNALVPELLESFLMALDDIKRDESVRAMVLQANGRTFSTGGDAMGFVEHAGDIETYARHIVGLLNRAILEMIDMPMPIITAVHGILTGGSLGFLMGSDIILVSPEARFAPFYSEVGPSPDGGWAGLLPLIIGRRRAAEVLYLNQWIDAQTAVDWGLANRIVPGSEIRQTAVQIAVAIAGKKQGSVRHTRRLLYWDRQEIASRLKSELDHFLQQIVTEEGIGGFREFLAGLQDKG